MPEGLNSVPGTNTASRFMLEKSPSATPKTWCIKAWQWKAVCCECTFSGSIKNWMCSTSMCARVFPGLLVQYLKGCFSRYFPSIYVIFLKLNSRSLFTFFCHGNQNLVKEKSWIINLPNVSKFLFRGKKGASSRKAFTQHQPDGFSVFASGLRVRVSALLPFLPFLCVCAVKWGGRTYAPKYTA